MKGHAGAGSFTAGLFLDKLKFENNRRSGRFNRWVVLMNICVSAARMVTKHRLPQGKNNGSTVPLQEAFGPGGVDNTHDVCFCGLL